MNVKKKEEEREEENGNINLRSVNLYFIKSSIRTRTIYSLEFS